VARAPILATCARVGNLLRLLVLFAHKSFNPQFLISHAKLSRPKIIGLQRLGFTVAFASLDHRV
jgi:hypothetical protein